MIHMIESRIEYALDAIRTMEKNQLDCVEVKAGKRRAAGRR